MLRSLKEKKRSIEWFWSIFSSYRLRIIFELIFLKTLKSVFLTFCNHFLMFSMSLILKREMVSSLFSVQFEVIPIRCLLQKIEKPLIPKLERSLQTDLSYSLKQIEKCKNHQQNLTSSEKILHLNEYQDINVRHVDWESSVENLILFIFSFKVLQKFIQHWVYGNRYCHQWVTYKRQSKFDPNLLSLSNLNSVLIWFKN